MGMLPSPNGITQKGAIKKALDYLNKSLATNGQLFSLMSPSDIDIQFINETVERKDWVNIGEIIKESSTIIKTYSMVQATVEPIAIDFSRGIDVWVKIDGMHGKKVNVQDFDKTRIGKFAVKKLTLKQFYLYSKKHQSSSISPHAYIQEVFGSYPTEIFDKGQKMWMVALGRGLDNRSVQKETTFIKPALEVFSEAIEYGTW
jgi:hypothetical protein